MTEASENPLHPEQKLLEDVSGTVPASNLYLTLVKTVQKQNFRIKASFLVFIVLITCFFCRNMFLFIVKFHILKSKFNEQT